MADSVHSTVAPNPTARTPSRRALLAGAAVMPALGAAAAPVAAGPDAELLALAAELRAAEDAYAAAARRLEAADGAGAEDAVDAAGDALDRLLARMAAIPAAGLAGIAAKAGRLTYSLADGRSIMHGEAPLVESLASDLARLVPAAVEPAARTRPSPDAELVRLGDEYEGLERAWRTFSDEEDAATDLAIKRALDKRMEAISARKEEIRDTLQDMPATTLRGFQAKAKIIIAEAPLTRDGTPMLHDPESAMAWNLATNLLRFEGAA